MLSPSGFAGGVFVSVPDELSTFAELSLPVESDDISGGVLPSVPVELSLPVESDGISGGVFPSVPVELSLPVESDDISGGACIS